MTSFTVPGKPELWKPVPGFEASYEVSDLGRVRSLPRKVKRHDGFTQSYPGKVLAQTIGTHGYPAVALCFGGKRGRTTTVHSIVAEAFIGPRPYGLHIRHLNGDQADPRLCNLVYGTRSENQRDRVLHGTHCIGERNPQAKLTAAYVSDIRSRFAKGARVSSLAAEFGVSPTTVADAVSGRTWGGLL